MYDVLAIQPWVLCPDMEEETGIVPSLNSSSPLLEGTHMYTSQQINLYSPSIHSTYLLLYGDGQRRPVLCSKVACSWEHITCGPLCNVVYILQLLRSILQLLSKLFMDSKDHWQPNLFPDKKKERWWPQNSIRSPKLSTLDLPLRSSGISGDLFQFSNPIFSHSIKWVQE